MDVDIRSCVAFVDSVIARGYTAAQITTAAANLLSVGHRTDAEIADDQICTLGIARTAGAVVLMKGPIMLYTLAVVLLILWVLGLATSYTLGGFIHILLVIAVVMVLLNLISGRRGL